MDRNVFASDNTSGLCPAAWAALQDANASGCQLSYGEDPFTQEACDLIREQFEFDAEVFFVFNGTAANSLSLASICQGHHAVVCHEHAHVITDECGAPSLFTYGAKVSGYPGILAKLTPDMVQAAVSGRGDLHTSKPRALSLTQATEFGTVYTIEELTALTTCAHSEGLKVHMDGARFAHALAHLQVEPADMTWRAGVDILSLGLAKLGAGLGEAVVVFDHDLAEEFDYRCKHAAQLASKMRLITAPWCGLLRDRSWITIASGVNQLALDLRKRLSVVSGVELLYPTEANAVFARLPYEVNQALRAQGWHYYELLGIGDSRLMCSWATRSEDFNALLTDINALS